VEPNLPKMEEIISPFSTFQKVEPNLPKMEELIPPFQKVEPNFHQAFVYGKNKSRI
jgi:hypothetical protein